MDNKKTLKLMDCLMTAFTVIAIAIAVMAAILILTAPVIMPAASMTDTQEQIQEESIIQ